MIKASDYFENETQYGYDAVGNQVSVVDAPGNEARHSYDDLNRLIQPVGLWLNLIKDPAWYSRCPASKQTLSPGLCAITLWCARILPTYGICVLLPVDIEKSDSGYIGKYVVI